MKKLVIGLVTIIGAFLASAATILPSSTAADTTVAIQAAIDAAASGATVELGEGLFEINAQLMVTNGVTLKGQGWEKTVIKQTQRASTEYDASSASGNLRCVVISNAASVVGVTLTGALNQGPNGTCGGGALVYDGTISWCCISNNAMRAANSKFGAGVYIMKGKIDHSLIANNTASASYGSSGGGGVAVVNPTGEVLVDACLICGNHVTKDSSNGDGGAGIYASFGNYHKRLTVRNTTIVGNDAEYGPGGLKVSQYQGSNPYPGDIAMINCIVADNIGGEKADDRNLVLSVPDLNRTVIVSQSSNNYFANGTASLGADSVSVEGSGSSLFVDAASGDYHLSSTSAAKGAGTTYTGIGNDLDDKPFASTPSIGCYEFAGSVEPVLAWTATANTASADSVRTDGVLKYAYTASSSALTVNGVAFAPWGASPSNADATLAVVGGGTFNKLDNGSDESVSGDYGTLLKSVYHYNGFKDFDATIKNLEVGKRYLAQFISHYHNGNPIVEVKGTDPVVSIKPFEAASQNWNYGGSLVCEFEATAATQTFTFTVTRDTPYTLNAVQVRELGDLPPEPTSLFNIGDQGYDSWTEAYAAAKNGDTIKLGQDFSDRFDAYLGKTFSLDLNGKSFNATSGWCADTVTVIDSKTGGSFGASGANFAKSKLDLSALDPSQIVTKISANNDNSTVVKFPASMTLDQCSSKISSQTTGTQIIVQGATYSWDGTAWVNDAVVAPAIGSVTASVAGTTATITVADIELGTGDDASAATSCSVEFELKNSGGTTVKGSTVKTGLKTSSYSFDITDIADGEYTCVVKITTDKTKTATKTTAAFTVTSVVPDPAVVFAKKVEFTVAGYTGNEKLANFPVLIKLSAAVDGFDYAECAKESIRFLDADGNLIPFEIDSWDAAGTSYIWVSVPELSGTDTKVTMCYGGEGSAYPKATGNVWTLAGYKSVWHMNIADGKTSDSVANYPATVYQPSSSATEYCGAGTGKIGGDYYCNANNKVHCVKTDSIEGFNASICTYTAWVRQIGGTMVSGKPDAGNYPNITWGSWGNCGEFWNSNYKYNASGNGIALGVEGGQNAAAQNEYQLVLRDTAETKANLDVSLFDTEWHYVVLRYSDAGRTVYVDGVLQSGFTNASAVHKPLTSGTMRMGARQDSAQNTDCVWTGDLDEMRFRALASSEAWLKAEYDNVTVVDFVTNGGATDIAGVSKPKFTPEATEFYPTLDVTLTCTTAGATIRYTLDGTEPTESSTVYTAPITLSETTTIKARVYVTDAETSELVSSDVAEATYTYVVPQPPVLGTVTVNPRAKYAILSGAITDLGNYGATSCDVYLAYGTDAQNLPAATKVASDVAAAFEYKMTGLTPETTYYYALSVSNNASKVMGAATSGSFTTIPMSSGTIEPIAGNPSEMRMTIQDAIDFAANLDEFGEKTVVLEDGLFEIDAQLMVTGGVTLVGQGWDNTTLKQTGAGQRVAYVDEGATIEGMTITGGATALNWEHGAGVYVKDGNLSWCNVVSNTCSMSYANFHGAGVYIHNGRVDHCIVAYNEGGSNNSYGGGIGGHWDNNNPNGNIVIDTCLVHHNSLKNGANQSHGGGIGFEGSSYQNVSITIRNSTIVDNESGLSGGGVYIKDGFKVLMVNNIVTGNSVINGQDEKDLSGSPYYGSSHNLVGVDASFVNAEACDYRLAADSPAVDVGLDRVDDVDLDHVARFKGTATDLGCYEHSGSIVLSTPTVTFSSSTEASVNFTIVSMDDGVSSARVSYSYGPDYEHLSTLMLLKENAVVGDELSFTINDLEALHSYYYSILAEPDKALATATGVKGYFVTGDGLQMTSLRIEPNSRGAAVRALLAKLGDGATDAEVTLAWGPDYDHLCDPVLLAGAAVEGQQLSYNIKGLENETTYVVKFTAKNSLGETAVLKGDFTTLPKEHLVLSSMKVSELTETTAKIGVSVGTIGEDASSARVTVSWGTAPDQLTESAEMDAAALPGAALTQTLSGLTGNTLYYYAITAENDADPSETVSLTGSFMTDDPQQPVLVTDRWPVPAWTGPNNVFTYDADSAGDPVTLEAGSPWRAVASNGYDYVYHSVVAAGVNASNFNFRTEADFRYNCAARIGDTYYLFLEDAVADASTGDTIELLRNTYALYSTMNTGNKVLTIKGNGFVVKVKQPFLDTTGYVNKECTSAPANVFVVGGGGDLRLENMTIMGGGETLLDGQAGSNNSSTPAVALPYSGYLEMDHVTITRSQGGLYLHGDAKAHLNACNLVRNARYCGGGLYNCGLLVMENSSLSENRSLYSVGGGAAAENQGLLIMNNCVICNNGSTEYGGAINNLQTAGGKNGSVYMMNMTMAGNFTSNTLNYGGGIGTHLGAKDLYMLNCVLCNNYHYNANLKAMEDSDIISDVGNNYFLYSVYGTFDGKAGATFDNCWTVEAANEDVFKGYSPFARTYEQAKVTDLVIPSPAFENDPAAPYARYAPLTSNDSAADVGIDGVYTYFNASDWRSGSPTDLTWLKMSYKTQGGEMLALGDCSMASESDLVTTYYESAFSNDVTDRELGVVGASGFGSLSVTYTLYLLQKPVHGTVSKNLTLNGTSYNEGAEVTVVATPDYACTFLGWYDQDDQLVSDKTAYTFTMTSDKKLYAKFSDPSDVYEVQVDCETNEKGVHEKTKIKVTRDWIKKAFPTQFPDGVITEANKATLESLLNAPDGENGLNHVWMDYVLGGLVPGDPDGRIWIRADQTADKTTLRFRMQELSQTKDCGFAVKYRLLERTPEVGSDYNRDGALANSGSFEEIVSSDHLKHRVIDMIFIPDGKSTSFEYVTTVNTAGIMKVDSEKAVEILAAPFVGFSPTNNPPIEATGYLKASCLSEGDVLYVYDMENANYLAWAVQANGTWASVNTYYIEDGMVDYAGGADASRTNSLPRGAGAWLERQDTSKPIYLFGQVVGTSVATSLEAGFNLVGSPTIAPFDASTLPAPAKKGATGDRLVIPTGGAPINCVYREELGAWAWQRTVEKPLLDANNNPVLHPITREPMVGVSAEWTTEGLTIPTGLGFWYYNSGSESVDLAWPQAQ